MVIKNRDNLLFVFVVHLVVLSGGNVLGQLVGVGQLELYYGP